MGARYLWFWTSDHDHHVPWPEQLALARHVRAHAATHPRPSVFRWPLTDVAILIPDGWFVSLENLWWVRALDKEGRGPMARAYRRMMKGVLDAVHDCLDRDLSFDITVDDGRELTGYKRLIRIKTEQ